MIGGSLPVGGAILREEGVFGFGSVLLLEAVQLEEESVLGERSVLAVGVHVEPVRLGAARVIETESFMVSLVKSKTVNLESWNLNNAQRARESSNITIIDIVHCSMVPHYSNIIRREAPTQLCGVYAVQCTVYFFSIY